LPVPIKDRPRRNLCSIFVTTLESIGDGAYPREEFASGKRSYRANCLPICDSIALWRSRKALRKLLYFGRTMRVSAAY
jgi:hypothetical protein